MGANHFNGSLTGVQKWRDTAFVKGKVRLTGSFTLNDGGYRRHSWASDAIIIRRADVESVHIYAQRNCCSRDYLLVRLPMKIGLRTGEVCTLKVENVDFAGRSFYVLDSKRKELYPLPLDAVSLSLIQDLVRDKTEGYVFERLTSWKNVKKGLPLSLQEVWHVIRDIGLLAGVKGFKPRILREFFAADWALVQKKSIITLKEILRHRSLETTQQYVMKLCFFEDIQREYNGVNQLPIIVEDCESPCGLCESRQICKFAPLPSCVSSCKFQKLKELKV